MRSIPLAASCALALFAVGCDDAEAAAASLTDASSPSVVPPAGDAGSAPALDGGSVAPPSSVPPLGSDAAVLPDGSSAGDGAVPPPVNTGDASTPADGSTPPPPASGSCCPDGNCLCHGDAPSALTASNGKFATAQLTLPLGTVYYPSNAEPPFASVALCGGFLNTGPEMGSWGTFYASHGIVTIITSTGAADDPNTRASKLLAAIDQLKGENTKAGSPLSGKLDVSRMGTSGYSMGGGGTTIASTKNQALKTSVGLAPWGPATSGVRVPTLLLCGSSDGTAPCSMSDGAYRGAATPKMQVTIDGVGHLEWFGPTNAGGGASGKYALAFQKVFLEGDQRWRPLLESKLPNVTIKAQLQ